MVSKIKHYYRLVVTSNSLSPMPRVRIFTQTIRSSLPLPKAEDAACTARTLQMHRIVNISICAAKIITLLHPPTSFISLVQKKNIIMCTVDGFLYFSLGSTSPTAQPPTSILRLSITHSSFSERGQ